MRIPIAFTVFCILGCGGVAEAVQGQLKTDVWPASVPQRFVALDQERDGGPWVVLIPCNSDQPAVYRDGDRLVVSGGFDVIATGTIRSVTEDNTGYHIHYLDQYTGKEASFDLLWGDPGHTWLGWEVYRYTPESWVGKTWQQKRERCDEAG
jgi:hypothetical protein